jgi:hypothetical protein
LHGEGERRSAVKRLVCDEWILLLMSINSNSLICQCFNAYGTGIVVSCVNGNAKAQGNGIFAAGLQVLISSSFD